jgi:selenocysteine lyase/cysteine desulfurase
MPGRRHFLQASSLLGLSPLFSAFRAPTRSWAQRLARTSSEVSFWRLVREQFPVTRRKTYFNCATLGPSPYPVSEAVKAYTDEATAQGSYGTGDNAREAVARFVGATPEEIALTQNTTQAINIVASGLDLNAGDEVIVTTHEHVGNALPWLWQQQQRGVVLKTFTPTTTAAETLHRIEALISPRTRVIAVPHITCTTGAILPLREIASLAKEKGVFSFFDGAHGTGSMALRLAESGCDAYASCAHKWLCGPAGTGFLFIRRENLERVRPTAVGAGSNTGWEISPERIGLDGLVDTAHRYDFGTKNQALWEGVAAAVDFFEVIGMEKIESYIANLADYLLRQLLELPERVEVLTPEEPASRHSIVTFRPRRENYITFNGRAVKQNLRLRVVPESGLNAIRISTHLFNTRREVDQLVELVRLG